MRKIAIVGFKGGIGKTTTCVNLGAALALRGHRTLIIDTDTQANVTTALGIKKAWPNPDPRSLPQSHGPGMCGPGAQESLRDSQ